MPKVLRRAHRSMARGLEVLCDARKGNGHVVKNTMRMDERLLTIREELEAGSVSPQLLVLLFNTSSEADWRPHNPRTDRSAQLSQLADASRQAHRVGKRKNQPTERPCSARLRDRSDQSTASRETGANGRRLRKRAVWRRNASTIGTSPPVRTPPAMGARFAAHPGVLG
jgi:hypothetical protein